MDFLDNIDDAFFYTTDYFEGYVSEDSNIHNVLNLLQEAKKSEIVGNCIDNAVNCEEHPWKNAVSCIATLKNCHAAKEEFDQEIIAEVIRERKDYVKKRS